MKTCHIQKCNLSFRTKTKDTLRCKASLSQKKSGENKKKQYSIWTCALKFLISEVWLLQRYHYVSKCSADISNLSMLQIITTMEVGGAINTILSQDLLLSDRSLPLISLSEISHTSCAMLPQCRTRGDEGVIIWLRSSLL